MLGLIHGAAATLLDGRRAPCRHEQPPVDVILHFGIRERLQFATPRDSLIQLAHLGLLQKIVEVRLADEDNLEQFRLVRLEVRQQTDFFEHARTEMLRLVDHDHGMGVQRNERREKLLERGDELMTRDV